MSEEEAKGDATEAFGLNKTWSVRFCYTARCSYEVDFRAATFEQVVDMARAYARTKLDRAIGDEENLEGDEVAFIREDWDGSPDGDWPEDEEVDLRAMGEPFSWDACEFVKRLAKLDPASTSDKTIVEYIVAAQKLLQKEDVVSTDSEAVP